MPRLGVFVKRKSTAPVDYSQDGQVGGSSFRVLERSEVGPGKSHDGVARLSRPVTAPFPRAHIQPDLNGEDDNMFADLKLNRGSGSSNGTKPASTSTDTSSRHSNVSTAPSSQAPPPETYVYDESRTKSMPYADIPVPPIPKSSSGFLNRAGRTFSFGGTKKNQAPVPSNGSMSPPPVPSLDQADPSQRARAFTASTTSTATPPKIDDQEFRLDLGDDLSDIFRGVGDKRASVAAARDGQQSRSLTSDRLNQPTPINADRFRNGDASPYSTGSRTSHDGLLGDVSPSYSSQGHERAPPVPRHASPLAGKSNRPSNIVEDEEAALLKESLAASKFLSTGSATTGRYRRNEDAYGSSWRQEPERGGTKADDNLFDTHLLRDHKAATRFMKRQPSPPRNRVMTPAQFEQYRKEKERGAIKDSKSPEDKPAEEEEDNYDEDDDEAEKSKQAAKERRKQETHMTSYRQKMMKVTGEGSNPPPRPVLPTSMSAPHIGGSTPSPQPGGSSSDEDEDVPLAILAAHGFPSKNRAPSRLSNMASNPNMRASMAPSLQQPRPGSSMGENPGPGARTSTLPAFARKLPQDPFLGAGLARPSNRESVAFPAGPMQTTAPLQAPPAPTPGGLIGIIASEEHSRAMRRGSPNMNGQLGMRASTYDPVAGIPPNMMYGMGASPSMPQLPMMGHMGMQPMPPMPPMPQMLTPGDQAQIQMTQQMQQFMEMQMQFMQMMATQQGRPNGHAPSHSMGEMSSRRSFVGGEGMEPPRLDNRMRTLSMVQPSSASWIQPLQGGYAPSIRVQGDGYAPSIAPSERSNIGLPGRYRPVSQAPMLPDPIRRVSTMSGALSGWDEPAKSKQRMPKSGNNSDDDDEGWEAMKAKREKKKSIWRSKKGLSHLGAMIS